MKFNNKIFLLLIFIFCVSMLGFWQMSNYFPDPDAFYHIKMAQLIFDQGIIKDFPWQQFTILKDNFTDHHLLYHIILIPFVITGYPFMGAKILTVLLTSLLIVVFSVLMMKLKLKGALWAGLLMALIAPLAFRLNLVKANSLSLIILFLGVYMALKYRYKWLAVLSFLYVWAYGGFALLIVLVGLVAVIDLIFSRKIKRNILLIISNVGGILAGVIINPYFPKNISFYWQQLVQIGIVNYQNTIGVGREWYPYGLGRLLTDCSVLTIGLLIALILFGIYIKKQNRLSWVGFFMFIGGLVLVLKSRRYIEYYVPFSIFFILVTINASLKDWPWSDLKNKYKNFWQKNNFNKIVLVVSSVYFVGMISAILVHGFIVNNGDLKKGVNYYEFKDAMVWLANSEQHNSSRTVLHDDWDEWPQLFYFNSYNFYICGLDPTFMYKYNQDLFWQWVDITLGKQVDDLPNIIKNNFKAGYIFVESGHTAMDKNIQAYPEDFVLIYEDNEAKIYEVK
ncbi:MAG: hypothetical protein V1898_00810 [Patescibacteria group bacterium]